MKTQNVLFAAVALAVSGTAQSENLASQPVGYRLDLGYQYQDNTPSSVSDTDQYQFGATYVPFNWLELGLQSNTVIGDKMTDANQLQASATGYYGFTDMFGTYGSGELGQTWTNDKDFSYGSVGAGVYVKPYGDYSNTQLKLGYRYRDSFDNDVDYETNSLVLSAEYAFTPVHSITAGYEYVDGNGNDLLEQNLFSIGYRGHF